ncbi:uncharacterized protein LOC111603015 [Drosophila hydei]|uniref:Uncharacterized protein LOC111603015 n=1 Tax=Drosophila hydei TaxID=7224 RepID=A0A6J1M7Q8_DROHY|nr:uncharacterized protein LOC111603015 [Drosophila hydei]XP_023176203.1 uncharacterized protein LOC111603015 [Drosophila hydei]
MASSNKEQWQKDYEHLVRRHHHDQKKVKHLLHQIRWLIVRHTITKYNVALESQRYGEKVKKVDDMRLKLEELLTSKTVRLNDKKRKQLRKLQSKLPVESLLDQIRLMELLQQVPTFSDNISHRMNHLQSFHGKSLKQMGRQQRGLNRINEKTQLVIKDINDLTKLITFLKKSRASKWEILPSLVHNWLERQRNFDLKCTVDTSNKKQHKALDVRSLYMLRHMSKIMPNIYNYLGT